MNHQIHNKIAFTVIVLFVSVAILACGRKNDQEAISRLPDLPQDRIGELKQVPGSQALATSHAQLVSGPPTQLGPPPPPCAKDASQEDYTAVVRYSITTCRTVSADSGDLGGILVEKRGATHKLANAGLAPDLQVKGPGQSGGGRVGDIFWTCRTDDGPWQGHLTRVRQCILSCSPENTLQLTNAPNLDVWQWYGRIQDHPADFQFNSNPVLLGRSDLGDCHTPGD